MDARTVMLFPIGLGEMLRHPIGWMGYSYFLGDWEKTRQGDRGGQGNGGKKRLEFKRLLLHLKGLSKLQHSVFC